MRATTQSNLEIDDATNICIEIADIEVPPFMSLTEKMKSRACSIFSLGGQGPSMAQASGSSGDVFTFRDSSSSFSESKDPIGHSLAEERG